MYQEHLSFGVLSMSQAPGEVLKVSYLSGFESLIERASIWARGTGDSLLRGMSPGKNGADRLSNVTVVRAVLQSESLGMKLE